MAKTHHLVALSLLVVLPLSALAEERPSLPEKLKVKELPEKYRIWLDEEVPFIMTGREKEVFLRLHTDELRDLFIQQFWDRRDPVPATPKNEYRLEFEKRLRYCKERYRIVRQDMVRTYLLLGPPTKINPHPSDSDFWPMEVWEYDTHELPTMPPRFVLLFYKRNNAGLFRLWSPTVDGFKALRTTSPASASMEREFNPGRFVPSTIAEAMKGLAPGLGPFGSEKLIMETQKPPPVDLTGVERILTGSVSTSLSYGALPFEATAKWYFGPHPRRRIVSVGLEVPASSVQFTRYRGEEFFGLFVAGQVRTADGTIVSEWSGNVDSTQTPDERESTQTFPFLYTYRFNLLPGTYTLNLVARDDSAELLGIRDIPLEIPPTPDGFLLSEPIFTYKLSRLADASANIFAPFVFDEVEILPLVDQVLTTKLPVTAFFQLRHPEGAAETERTLHYSISAPGKPPAWEDSEPLAVGRANTFGTQSILKLIDLQAVPAGSYRFEVRLEEEGTTLASTSTEVTVLTRPKVTGRLIARSFEREDPARAALSAGQQLLVEGDYGQAREQFRVALGHDPDLLEAKVNLARAMVLDGDPALAESAMVEVTSAGSASPDAWMILGAARAGLGEFAGAATAYEEAIGLTGESPAALNALAEARQQAGDLAGARVAAERSLELNPDQPLLKRFLDELP